MFGDVRKDEGFWYSHQLFEIDGLTEEQLFWVPNSKGLCIYEVFGADWCSTETLRQTVNSVKDVLAWVRDVRESSHDYIASLTQDDFHAVPPTTELELSVGYWLFITAAHTALHIGRIQLLRALIEDKHERPC
jgi:hypothetical protein